MTIDQFVKKYHLRSADVIVTKKVGWRLLNHTVTYLGIDQRTGEHLFSANMFDGVRVLKGYELPQLLKKFEPHKIKRLQGNERKRKLALQRAVSRLGENNYNILLNNCEHYTTFVQEGKSRSPQVAGFVGLALIGIVVAGLASGE